MTCEARHINFAENRIKAFAHVFYKETEDSTALSLQQSIFMSSKAIKGDVRHGFRSV